MRRRVAGDAGAAAPQPAAAVPASVAGRGWEDEDEGVEEDDSLGSDDEALLGELLEPAVEAEAEAEAEARSSPRRPAPPGLARRRSHAAHRSLQVALPCS